MMEVVSCRPRRMTRSRRRPHSAIDCLDVVFSYPKEPVPPRSRPNSRRSLPMMADAKANPEQVIVSIEECACHTVHIPCAHHRNFPEIRAEGETPEVAAVTLSERLTNALEGTEGG